MPASVMGRARRAAIVPHQITDVQGVFTPLTLHQPMAK